VVKGSDYTQTPVYGSEWATFYVPDDGSEWWLSTPFLRMTGSFLDNSITVNKQFNIYGAGQYWSGYGYFPGASFFVNSTLNDQWWYIYFPPVALQSGDQWEVIDVRFEYQS